MEQRKEVLQSPSVYDQLEGLNYDVDELVGLLSTLRQKVPASLLPTVSSLESRFSQLSSAWQGFCLDSSERVSEERRNLQQGLRRKHLQDTERRRSLTVREAQMIVKEREFQRSLRRVKDLWDKNSTQIEEVLKQHTLTHQMIKKEGETRLQNVATEMSEVLGTSPPHLRRQFKLDLDHVKVGDDSQRKITSNSDTSYKYSADRTVHGSPGEEDLVSHRSAFIDEGDISARNGKGQRQLSDRVNPRPPTAQRPKQKQEQVLDKSESLSWAEFDKAYDEMRKDMPQDDQNGPNISMEKPPSAWDSALESESEVSVAATPDDIQHAIQVLIEAGVLKLSDELISQLVVQMAQMYSLGKIKAPLTKPLRPDNARNYNAPFAPPDHFHRRRAQELADISRISHAEDLSDFAATSPKHLLMFISEDPTKTMLSSEQVSARGRPMGDEKGDLSKELEDLLACDSSAEAEVDLKSGDRVHEFGIKIPGRGSAFLQEISAPKNGFGELKSPGNSSSRPIPRTQA